MQKAFLVICGVLLFFESPASCQTSWSTIAGRVTDSTDAGIPNALVRAHVLYSTDFTETHTSGDGSFSLTFLSAGNYVVEVNATGFKELKRDSIVLRGADTLELPLTMEVGDMSDHVSVSAEPDELQTSTASRMQRFELDTVSKLPLIGRQSTNLITLAPGVLFAQEQYGSNGFSGLRSWDANGKYIINGGKEGTNQFLLNGAPISLTGKWQISPSVEAVQEVRVMTNTYDAQFGRTGGGTVNTTLRSGGQAWHGSLYEFFHNAVFDANSNENNLTGTPRGKHITHQFGGALGGTVRKDKDFVFLSMEGFNEIAPFPIVADTPPANLRDGQHFSQYGIKVFDPLTGHRCVSGVDTPMGVPCLNGYVRNRFPGNVIPLSRMSPIGRAILDLYPLPNSGGLTENFLAGGNSGRYSYFQPIARWDHNFGERDRLYGLMTYQHGTEMQNSNGFPGPASIGSGTNERTNQNYIAEWTRVLSPTTIFDLRLSFGRFTEYFPESSCLTCLTADSLGILKMPRPPTVAYNTAPRVDLDLYSSIIANSYTWSTQNQWDVAPSFTYVRRGHALHLGMEFAYAGLGNSGPGRANGQFSFTRQWTQQYAQLNRGALDGSGVADLLLGLPGSGYIDYNESFYRTWPYAAAYIQDTWKIRSNVTLNLGLRYDVQIPFLERFNRLNEGFDFQARNPLTDAIRQNWADLKAQYDATGPKYPYPAVPAALYGGKLFAGPGHRRPYNTDWTDIQPRVGVAWSFAPKTVFRAGAGIFYRTATQLNFSDGFSQQTAYDASFDGGLNPSAGITGKFSLQDPFPFGIRSPGSTRSSLTDVGSAFAFDGRQRVIPRTYEYSAGIQRELPGKIFADVSYSGSVTVHDNMRAQLDPVSYANFTQWHQDPQYLSRPLKNPFVGILPSTSELGGAAYVPAYQLLRPYPLYYGVLQTTNPWGRYRYDSLQVQIEKKVFDSASTGILSFLLGYTFSKSFEASHRLNAWNLRERPIHELTALDKPHSLAFAGTWDVPIGWGKRWLNGGNRFVGYFTNGWSLDWIFTYYSGYPVNKPDALFSCASYVVPNQSGAHWFNNDPSCYATRPAYVLRTTEDRFSRIRTPAAPQMNLSVEKTFWIGEKYLFQLRGESYNLGNTPIFAGPVTDVSNPRFGQIPFAQSNFPRYVQVAAKFVF